VAALIIGTTSTSTCADSNVPKSLDTASAAQIIIIGKLPIGENKYTSYSTTINRVENLTGGERGGGSAAISKPGKTDTAKPPSNNNTDLPPKDQKQDCSSAATNGTETSGNPVVIATGEKIKSEADFSPAGIGALGLTRTYRSNGDFGMFGQRWRSNYDWRNLGPSGCYKHADYPGKCIPTEVTVTFPDGANYTYKPRNLNDQIWLQYYAVGAESMGRLNYYPQDFTNPTTYWTLVRDDVTYLFNALGKIASIGTKGVSSLSFNYGTNGLPATIQRADGRAISFTYSNNRVMTSTDTAGGVWNYTYNTNGMLASAISPGASPSVRSYHYEDAADATLLTGISINGVRYSTYKYFANRKVQESGLADGQEKDSFQYPTNQTVITDATGHTRTYNFVLDHGVLKTSSIIRSATSNCAAAAAYTFYDPAGWVDYTLDNRGIKTDYSFDAAGKLLSVTSAAGTPVASTRTNLWSGSQLMSTTYADAAGNAYKRVNYSYHPGGTAAGLTASETWTDLSTNAQRQFGFTYTFHPNGGLASSTVTRQLPGGTAVATQNYDTRGNLTSAVNPLNQSVSWNSYNGLGLPGSMVDANGIATSFSYDSRGNTILISQALPTGTRSTSLTYNGDNRVLDVLFPTGAASRLRYTAAMRQQQVGNAAQQFVTRSFDPATRVESFSSARDVPAFSGGQLTATGASSFTTQRKLDCNGLTCQSWGNNGRSLTYVYDGNGNVERVTDVAGRITRHEYDAQNRVTKTIAPDTGITKYRYDSRGNCGRLKIRAAW
jgi:YD repeat-containing protein